MLKLNSATYRPSQIRVGLRTILLGVLCFMSQGVQAEARYRVCEQQLVDFVVQELGETPVNIDFRWAYESFPKSAEDFSYALVYTQQCAGHHEFTILAHFETCVVLSHYGETSSLIHYDGSRGC